MSEPYQFSYGALKEEPCIICGLVVKAACMSPQGRCCYCEPGEVDCLDRTLRDLSKEAESTAKKLEDVQQSLKSWAATNLPVNSRLKSGGYTLAVDPANPGGGYVQYNMEAEKIWLSNYQSGMM